MSSNKWNAMDLHATPNATARFQQRQADRGGGRGYNTRSSAAAAAAVGSGTATPSSAMRVDDTGLSARNILLRRKLQERKRFDSADHAMKTSHDASDNADINASQQAQQTQPQQLYYTSSTSRASPAQVGATVLFNALGSNDSDNVDMDVSPESFTATDRRSMAQSTAAAARGASRYGHLTTTNTKSPAGGAASARSILLQKKLREKKHFDSADYQLARVQSPTATDAIDTADADAVDDDAIDDEEERDDEEEARDDAPTPMEIDPTPAAASTTTTTARPVVASINSPSAASVATARSRVDAQMSPPVRGGQSKYGSVVGATQTSSGANALLMRKLSEKKRFDSADYQMEMGPATARASANANAASNAPTFFVPAAMAAAATTVAPPGAPQLISQSAAAAAGASSKYGKLSAANVLIRKKLKERKRFDSADYAMEKQGRRAQQQAANAAAAHNAQQHGGYVLAHATTTTPLDASTPHTVPMADVEQSPAAPSPVETHASSSINHQVKHIKLSEGGRSGGWAAARVSTAASSTSSSPSTSAAPSQASSSMSHDNRLVARNLIIQRKLSERKRFDSADYFKEAAKHGQH